MNTESTSEPAVKVRDIKVQYGERIILNGVDMTVPQGEIRVILGGSGCGKSTLLKSIIGLAPVSQGEVELLGVNLGRLSPAERLKHLQNVGVLFQNGALLGSMTAGENVALPLREHTDLPDAIIREMVRMKLDQVDLIHAVDLYPSQLSGGMRKRVALARAMALDPKILFCDEPSAGLDPLSSARLDELLLSLRDQFKMSIVIVTHELQSIETITDSIIFLAGGHVAAEGAFESVRADKVPEVEAFFSRKPDPSAIEGQNLASFFMGER